MASKRFIPYLILVLTFLPLLIVAKAISFTRVDGLANNFVNTVVQTDDGYIWVGTSNGILRYDGVRFRRLIIPELPEIPVDQLLLTQESKSILLRLEHKLFLLNPKNNKIQNITIDRYGDDFQRYQIRIIQQKGQIFLIIHGRDILMFNEAKRKFESNKSSIDFPSDWKPTWVQYGKNGKIWISGLQGMGYFDPADKTFHTSSKLCALKNITRFFIDSKSRFFVYTKMRHTNGSVYLFGPKYDQQRLIGFQSPMGSNYHDFYDFFEYRNATWAYGLDIFHQFNENRLEFTQPLSCNIKNPAAQINKVAQVYVDRDNILWVATDNGLYMMSVEDNIRYIFEPKLFGNAGISDLAIWGSDQILVSSWGEQIAAYEYNSDIISNDAIRKIIFKGTPLQDSNFNYIWTTTQDPRSGNLWIGCRSGRLILFDPKTQIAQFLVPKIFEEQSVRQIAIGNDGSVWFGLDNGKVFKKEKDRFTLVNDLGSAISCIRPGYNNTLWIGTSGSGLFALSVASGKVTRRYTSGINGLTSSKIRNIAIVGNHQIAIAGYSGLDILDISAGHITQYDTKAGLPQNIVMALVTDNRGMLWMTTATGICRFDPNKKEFRSFDNRYSLMNMPNAANLLIHGIKLQNGTIAFGSDRNILIVDPTKFDNIANPKKMYITDFKLFDNYLSVDSLVKLGSVTLEHWQNFFTISYSTLSYKDQGNLKYYYRLQGASSKWIQCEPQLTTNFASLSPGQYVFMLRSQNQEGQFSPITKFPITIRPAFYQSWWFLSIVVFVILLGFYILHRYRLHRLMEVHSLREKVARDLHDDVGSTLTSIHILSEVAKKNLSDEQHVVQSFLDRIGKNSSQMMQAMDDIVWSIKPDNDLLQKIVARMREYATSILDPLMIQSTFTIDGNIRHIILDMEQRRNLFLIYKEALNNITKYAAATKVDISIRVEAAYIDLLIKDNGRGFDTSKPHSGNGLFNMEQRVKALGGTLKISSSAHLGTIIWLTIRI
ncbi:MAG: histidine kinase [Sphingobacterium sp.]|jgi:ligand-binding sensor domain-containing protein/two-component sensor histidine kinase|nr:histidine kinase [Sphingobacterium sp.]